MDRYAPTISLNAPPGPIARSLFRCLATLASTVPPNGDVNLYGVTGVPPEHREADRRPYTVQQLQQQFVNGPWDMTAPVLRPPRNCSSPFVLTGGVAANGRVRNRGTVVRLVGLSCHAGCSGAAGRHYHGASVRPLPAWQWSLVRLLS